MTDKDTIMLPREVVERARKAVVPMAYHTPPYERDEIAAILRTALAAEQPKPEPVVWWDVNKPLDYLTRCENGTTFHNRVIMPRHAVAWAYTNSPEDAEALRRDAERYRWLRERAWFQFEFDDRYGDSGETVQELDAAIDAAMGDKT